MFSNYDVRFADLALPQSMRKPAVAKKLFAELLSEGVESRVRYLVDYLGSIGLAGVEVSREGLLQLDPWWASEADLQLEGREDRHVRMESLLMEEPTRAVAVDMMLAVGEVFRSEYPEASWILTAEADAGVYRYLPGIAFSFGDEWVRYLGSYSIYIGFASIARIRAGRKQYHTPCPVWRAFTSTDEFVDGAKRRAAAGRPERRWPAIPDPPPASVREYERALEAGELGEIGSLWVIAAPTRQAALTIAQTEPVEESTDAVSSALVDFVTELYTTWPFVKDGSLEMESPYETDLYECIEGDVLELEFSKSAPWAGILDEVTRIAHRRGMWVFHKDDNKFLDEV